MMFHIIVVLLFLCGSIEASASETKSFEGCTVHLVPPSHYTANSSICDGITWAKGRPDNDFLVYNMQSGRLFHYVNDTFEHGKYDVLNTTNWDLTIYNPQKEDSDVYYFKHSDQVLPMNLQVEELHETDLDESLDVRLNGKSINSSEKSVVLLNTNLTVSIATSEIQAGFTPDIRLMHNSKLVNATDDLQSDLEAAGKGLYHFSLDTSLPGEYVYTVDASICDKASSEVTITVIVLDLNTTDQLCQYVILKPQMAIGWPAEPQKVHVLRKYVLHSDKYIFLPEISASLKGKPIPMNCDGDTTCHFLVPVKSLNKRQYVTVTTKIPGLDGSCDSDILITYQGISARGVKYIILACIGGLFFLGILISVCLECIARRKKAATK